MPSLRVFVVVAALLASLSVWAQNPSSINPDDARNAQLVQEGAQLAKAHRPAEAIDTFDKVTGFYESAYRNETGRLYSARTQPEALMYLLEAANAKTSAKIVSSNWAYAYYLKAYAMIELNRMDEAKVTLQRAIDMSPHNAQFRTEMGGVYQREKNWPMAITSFETAERDAREFSAPNIKNTELARAWRGLAYVYVEQNRLDEAEALYRKCLELDANDTRAASELRYLQAQRAKAGNP
ncbi:tetratricopeptide repeat protein (plasmid) [Ralstonia sp. 25C]|uniref:tetratricopeptide repeat protein n=1 Tax=Ralstonia sp. 25C TaxID=3447363 RepID=UPI003F74C098